MGVRGPAPKRSSKRRRANKTPPPDKPKSPTKVVKVPPVKASWHPQAKDWYRSLKESGQAMYYEPSDWQAARVIAEELSVYLRSKKRSAMMFSHIWSAMSELLTTEGSRRRVRMEVERDSGEPATEDSEVASLDAYRKRLSG